VAKRSSLVHTENESVIETFLQSEVDGGVHTIERYAKFNKDCAEEVSKLTQFIDMANADGKQTYIYGASTKGNCLLQYAGINSTSVPFAVERNPLKVGRTTSTGIEIISEETMRANPPAFMLVLPWHFRSEIIAREKQFLDQGGQLLFPFPKFEVYSTRPKTVITGVDGQIGSHVEELLTGSNSIYGLVTQKKKFDI
jgi:hypothetical protein